MGKSTNVNLVALELGPVKRVLGELDSGPVERAPVGSVGGADRVGMEDEADGSLLWVGHELGHITVDLIQPFNAPLCFPYLLVGLQEQPADPLGIPPAFGLELAQPADLGLQRVVDFMQHTDPVHDVDGGILVGLAAKDNNLLAALGAIWGRYARVAVHRGRANDMGSCDSEDVVVVIAAAEVEGDCTLVVGRLGRGNGETERGRKGMSELGDGIEEGIEGRELRATTREGRSPLSDSDVDVGETGLGEDRSLDVVGSLLRGLESERVGWHADDHEEGAKGGLLPSVGKSGAHDRGELDTELSVQICLCVLEEPAPDGCDGVVVNRAHLAEIGLRVRAAPAFRPGWTRLIDAGSPAGRTVEVCECVWVVGDETGPRSLDVGFVELGGSG
jgi:hypothetical protein